MVWCAAIADEQDVGEQDVGEQDVEATLSGAKPGNAGNGRGAGFCLASASELDGHGEHISAMEEPGEHG